MFSYPREDVVAGSVVFLVALPLCLGIAVACGVPPVSGLIGGIVGGLVVPWISRSPLSVSGPAAGLTSIVLVEVEHLGGIGPFLAAVILAGVLQAGFGLLRVGRYSAIVPSAVIQGMLAAIGATIISRQVPVAFGVKGALADIASRAHLGATLLAAISLFILYTWKRTPLGKYAFLPPALIAVVVTSALAFLFEGDPRLALTADQFVGVPLGGAAGLVDALPRPEFSAFGQRATWIAAITIAVVASIETLLSIQAVDRLDPLRRVSPPDRELVGQGVGNLVSGLLGGLPITSVIVRSGANVAAGGRERLSAIVHALLLVVAVVFAGPLLNRIPLAALAGVLIQVGLNLCKPSTFVHQYRMGMTQFVPFMLTITAVLVEDLLVGVVIGVVAGVLIFLFHYASGAIVRSVDGDGTVRLRFRRDATFLVKPNLQSELGALTAGQRVIVDTTGEYVDYDVKEALVTFISDAHARGISIEVVGVDLAGVSGGGH
jgi:MFS superfamily sulfate permease-like transporter